MNIERYIFKTELKQEYVKEFNDYLVDILYPDIKKAEDYS